EREAMEALPFDEGDLARTFGVAHVPDAEAAPEVGWDLRAGRGFAVDQHHAVYCADLVRMNAGRDRQLGELSRPRRIAHVDDGGSVRRLHVGDERRRPAHHHLATARTIEVADLSDAARLRH